MSRAGIIAAAYKLAAGPGPNLHTNPGFEANITGYVTSLAGALTRVTTEAHSGVAAARFAAGTNHYFYGPYATIVPGTTYEAFVWIKGGAGVQVQISVRNGGTNIAVSSTVTLTGSWQQVSIASFSHATFNAAYILVYNIANALATPYFADDFTIRTPA